MVDRENVVAQEYLETTPFGKFRNRYKGEFYRKWRDIFRKGLWKAFLFCQEAHLSYFAASFSEKQDR